MEELKDYSGPYIPGVRYENFSKEVLCELLRGYSMEINTLSFFYAGEIRKRYGDQVSRDISIEVWKKMARPEMEVAMKAAKITGNDIETYAKVQQLVGSFAQDYYRYEWDIKDKNHAVLTVHECPAFSMMEKRGDWEALNWTCHVIELEGMKAYAPFVNPNIRIRELRAGRRQSPDEPACRWEFRIEE